MNAKDQQSWPISQTVLSWLFVIGFVFVMTGSGFWKEVAKDVAKHNAERVFAGTPEFDRAMKEAEDVVAGVRQSARDSSLTIKSAAEAQMKVVAITAKLEEKFGGFTAEICELAESNFIANWQPPKEMSRESVEFLTGNPERKRQHLDMLFHHDWIMAQDEARKLFPETDAPLRNVGIMNLLRLVAWVLRWYYLLTVPALLIFLTNRRYKGDSVFEELVLQPRRLLTACMFGPFGLIVISDTAAKALRYRQLEDEFYLKYGRRPNDEQEQAIRRQVEKPLLQFEQALEQVRTSSERIRRPLAVCAVAWVLGLMSQPMLRQILPQPVACESLSRAGDNNVKSVSGDDNPSGKELPLAILPAAVGWQVEEGEKGEPIAQENAPRDVLWEAVLARGPPPAAEEQPLSMNDSALSTAQCGKGMCHEEDGCDGCGGCVDGWRRLGPGFGSGTQTRQE